MTQENKYQGPLAGLNVIDFGHYFAGPMVGMILADQGANVIRIVKPGGPELPSQQYRLLTRNKKLLELDLKTKEGNQKALSLIECADVLIENFRPGVMERLGLDYASIKDLNTGLVYLSLPGFASSDKERAHLKAWEGILSAAAGVFTSANENREKLGFPPVYSWVPQCSMYGGYCGSLGVMAALVARETYGQGTMIEVPLADAGVQGWISHIEPGRPSDIPLPNSLKPQQFRKEDSEAVQLEKLYKTHLHFWDNPYGAEYPCADGRKIYIYACYPNVSEYSRQLLKALSIDEQLKRKGFVNAGLRETGLDNNLSDIAGLSVVRKQRLKQSITEKLLTKTSTQWEKILADAGIAVSIIRTRAEWLALEPMLDSGIFTRMDDGKSALIVPGRMADVSGSGSALIASYREAESITYAEADELLRGPVLSKFKDSQHQNAPSPLKKSELLRGLKVLDLGNMLAGPYAGSFLAEYGANVIKADPPVAPGIVTGKRSILTDVKTAPGREVFDRLVSWADVVTHNILDNTTPRLGATHGQLKAINPNVVSCQISAFGGTWRNYWENRAGFDPIVQSASGLMAQFGTLEIPIEHGLTACGDISGGLSLAFTALLGVYQQRKTGYAGEGRTSLARMANYYQLPYMIADEEGRSDWGEARGQFTLGEHWWQRLYACRDFWIYVDSRECRAKALAETVTGHSGADEQSLESAFSQQDCEYWLARLQENDIACHQALNFDDIFSRYTRQVSPEEANEVAPVTTEILQCEHPISNSTVNRLAPNYVRVGEQRSWKRSSTDPAHGQHTVEILRELGFLEAEISELIRLKVSYEHPAEALNY